ncbi:alkaline shock response membrane anchor protein AmaP [Paenibacillus turpanensis]|uniref:alkaline shock response membrane anchor protein AmaP n=1 Tax=Paenibacillus turpanensis TaxID=2689078 RepID=UPI00140CCA65|nr:alkaline shock response membrane anchor protein AmaP [Paenibacillus turpanensis]
MIRVADKFLLFVFSLLVIVISFGTLLLVSGVISPEAMEPEPVWLLPALYSVSAILILLSLRFLYLSLRRSRSGAPSIDQRTDFGDIRISLETVENLSLKAASKVRGVRDLKARVRVTDAGLEISIRTVVDGETSIPSMTEEVQSSVKGLVEDITGIPVSFVSVFVANIVQSQTFKSRVE